jgi:hypothetical protein
MTICELSCKELVAMQTRGKTRKQAGGEGHEGLPVDEKSCLAIGHVEPSHRRA